MGLWRVNYSRSGEEREKSYQRVPGCDREHRAGRRKAHSQHTSQTALAAGHKNSVSVFLLKFTKILRERETDRAPDLRCVVDSEDGVPGEVDGFVTG